MTCHLGPDKLCNIIGNLRIAEDSISTLVLLIIIYLLLDIAFRMIKQGPLYNRILAFAAAFVPFLLWKFFGAFRRIFLDKSSSWYAPLHDFGEVMEAVTALFILGALVYMYLLLKPDKIEEKLEE